MSTSKLPEVPEASSVSTAEPGSDPEGTIVTVPLDMDDRYATVSRSPWVSSASLTEIMTGMGTGVTSSVDRTARRWSDVHGLNPMSTSGPPSSPMSWLSSVETAPAA